MKTYTYKPSQEEIDQIREFKKIEHPDIESLCIIHKHERDDGITKNEETHTYNINDEVYTSVTTIKSKFIPSFDPLQILGYMFKPKKQSHGLKRRVNGAIPSGDETPRPDSLQAKTESIYHNKTAKEITEMWSKTAHSGTKAHQVLENFFNEYYPHIHKMKTLEIEYHLHTLAQNGEFKPDTIYLLAPTIKYLHDNDWRIYRTEWPIYDEDYMIAGTIDAVFYRYSQLNPNIKHFMILDWKTKTKYDKIKEGSETCYAPFRESKACNLTEYQFQLSTYAYILQNKYGLSVSTLCAVVITPDKVGVEYLPILNMKQALDIHKGTIQIDKEIKTWLYSNEIKDFPIIKEPAFTPNNAYSENTLLEHSFHTKMDVDNAGTGGSASAIF